MVEALGLLAAGILAGLVGSVVSLASIVSYPALLAFGLPPVTANVTNTVSLVFSGVGAVIGSRPELAGQGRRLLRLSWLTALGGAAGAVLLLLTPAAAFERIAPWLIFGASLVILRPPRPRYEHGPIMKAGLFAVAVYVGYFGAAGGVLVFAVLAAMVEAAPARINALKNALSVCANLVAAALFAVFGPVDWTAVPPLALGFLAGGWLGPAIARRLRGDVLRYAIAGCGMAVALKLALS
ncbi:sulfite exporter TauE/SafE family protein [Thermoactinospora rubra]|uniref:sulfite exporter TauE/SafE family protein n=1 Tax=Thermoactinospora rubra TaxID=1088767 RepID=UPI00117DB758|nr:sulfite exporter TauE/SafE family protein [Thermoactinospora rubra]